MLGHDYIHDIEKTSLEAHVSLCQERYLQLAARIESVETKLGSLELTLQDIKRELRAISDKNINKWDTTQVAVIGILLSICGVLVSKLMFGH